MILKCINSPTTFCHLFFVSYHCFPSVYTVYALVIYNDTECDFDVCKNVLHSMLRLSATSGVGGGGRGVN